MYFRRHFTYLMVLLWNFIAGKNMGHECQNHEEYQMKSGRIYSPSYPELYPSNFCKVWYITGNTDEVITISFRYYDIEVGDAGSCNRDKITIGPDPSLTLCGQMKDKPVVYISQGKHVTISFKTDYETNAKGFELMYIIGKLGTLQCAPNNSEFRCNNGKCIYMEWKCNGGDECGDNSDEAYCPDGIHIPTTPASLACNHSSLLCQSRETSNFVCLSNRHRCDGTVDCIDGSDEKEELCPTYKCDSHIDGTIGYIQSPGYPHGYPNNLQCMWTVHVRDAYAQVQIRFQDFNLQREKGTDYLKIYDGTQLNGKVIGTFHGSDIPDIVESSTDYVTLLFHTDSMIAGRGFNVSYQKKGECLSDQSSCGPEERDCYPSKKRCDGIWDCREHGRDEKGCGKCQKDQFSCGSKDSHQCYDEKQRCNGMGRCADMEDELNCTPIQCGSHNGTFLCDNKRCIYETWKCDKTNDCDDNSDEMDCPKSTNLIIIAAVAGSLICALLLVVALGCTCKLYNLRMHQFHGPRHETPLSRIYAEFMRRRAPPPYHEAMQTSRPYDEVRRELLEQSQNERSQTRRHRRHRSQQPSEGQSSETCPGEDGRSPARQDLSGLPETFNNLSNLQGNNPLIVDSENSTNSTNITNIDSATDPLIPNDSCDSSDSEVQNSSEPGVHVRISNEMGISARWRRHGQHKPNTDNNVESSLQDDELGSPQLSVDGISVDATITSCDSAEMSVPTDDKPCDNVTSHVPTQVTAGNRHRRENSVDSSSDSDENSGDTIPLL